jgi:hypothetical protein
MLWVKECFGIMTLMNISKKKMILPHPGVVIFEKQSPICPHYPWLLPSSLSKLTEIRQTYLFPPVDPVKHRICSDEARLSL